MAIDYGKEGPKTTTTTTTTLLDRWLGNGASSVGRWSIVAVGGDGRRRGEGSPSISIIIRNQKVPVSFHTGHPSISIQKISHPSNSIQDSLLFPYKVENGCFLKNNHFNIPKACAGQSKNSSSEGKYSTILTMETPQGVVNLAQKKNFHSPKK